jgi:hypothetical protein
MFNAMTALYQSRVTDLIDQTIDNDRRVAHRQRDAPPEA